MPATVLCIGDPHFQVSNIPEVELFIEHIINLATEKQPDLIIILGDLLHTHELLHSVALNKACEFIEHMRMIAKTYVLVGNHDMYNNQQFLTENHWMNALKDREKVVIVDKVVTETIKGEKFVFCPYVFPGRFVEALNTLKEGWHDASGIFAHQEFYGCKMGAIVSVEGDKWPLDYPYVISGHIHSRQIIQDNVYYTGSAMQHAFGESEKNIIAHLTFDGAAYEREEIDLGLPRKKIIYMDVEDLDTYQAPTTKDQIKVTVSGSYDQFKALKKTKKYKKLLDDGVKVVFKPKKIKNGEATVEEEAPITYGQDFNTILNNIILDQKDPYLSQVFNLVVNGKETAVEDLFFI